MQRLFGKLLRRDQANRNDPPPAPTAPTAPSAPIAPIDPQGAIAGIGRLPHRDATARRGHAVQDAISARHRIDADGEVAVLTAAVARGEAAALAGNTDAEYVAVAQADDKEGSVRSNRSSLTSNASSQTETTPDRPISPFSRLDSEEKIQRLLEAADEKINEAEHYDSYYLEVVTTEIGSRNLTAKACLEFALEIALENRREQVPDISLRLVNILNANDQVVRLYGVDFPRARIEEWSNKESLPEPIQVRQEFIDKDGELGIRYGEDVHNRPVRIAGNKQLEVMDNRTPAGSKKTAEETDAEIRRYIATQPPSELAMAAFNRIMQRNGAGEFNRNFAPVLAKVWGYIEQCTNQEMKQNLRNSMFRKLVELGEEWPCPPGVIQRIADIPTAIDLSLPQEIPEEEIFTELAKMAGDINASFEDDNAFNCSGSREEAGPDENSPARMAVEAAISDWKRDMFFAKARVELVLLRNIDANFVMTAAERVFPKGALL